MKRTNAASRPLRALLIEECEETQTRVSEGLAQSGYDVTRVSTLGRARSELGRGDPVLLVCRLEDPPGCETLFESQQPAGSRRVLMYTERGRPSAIAAALRSGVDGVFEYPSELTALCESARRLAPGIANTLCPEVLSAEFVGSGRAMVRVRDQILALSQLRVPVLLRGEPGSGRRHAARLVCGPTQAPREVTPNAPLTRLPREPRSYLLRDVDLFPPQAQGFWASVLRGDASPAPLRVVASSTQDLGRLAREGRFDAGLAEALTRFELMLPPLRERREDIPTLAIRLAERSASSLGRPGVRLTRGALSVLQREAWPENLRGLRVVLEQAVAFSSAGVVGAADIRALFGEGVESVRGLRSARAREDKEALIRELRIAGGNLAEVGRRLGISRGAVIYRAQKYGLLPEPGRSRRGAAVRDKVDASPS